MLAISCAEIFVKSYVLCNDNNDNVSSVESLNKIIVVSFEKFVNDKPICSKKDTGKVSVTINCVFKVNNDGIKN